MKTTILTRILLVFAFVATLNSLTSSGQETNGFGSAASPNLRKLLAANPAVAARINNACGAAFSGKQLSLYYFYCDDASVPRAYHFYPNTVGLPDVVICVRANQEPWDELLCVAYELFNSRNEKKFQELFERARAGTVNRPDFADEIFRAEFEATLATRDLAKTLTLPKRDKAKSHYYKLFLECPTNYEAFVSYSRDTYDGKDQRKEYEVKYDSLRKAAGHD